MSHCRVRLLSRIVASALLTPIFFGLGVAKSSNDSITGSFDNFSTRALHGFQPLEDPPDVRSVSFCALVNKSSLYDQAVVRTTAILIAGYEQFFFYSAQCDGQDNLVWSETD